MPRWLSSSLISRDQTLFQISQNSIHARASRQRTLEYFLNGSRLGPPLKKTLFSRWRSLVFVKLLIRGRCLSWSSICKQGTMSTWKTQRLNQLFSSSCFFAIFSRSGFFRFWRERQQSPLFSRDSFSHFASHFEHFCFWFVLTVRSRFPLFVAFFSSNI